MTHSAKRVKVDIPFQSDAEINELVRTFEAQTWPYERWTHRAHLAIATYYLQQYDFDEATARIRQNINRYNHACGNPDGYHETITIVFMRLVAWILSEEIIPAPSRPNSMADLVNRLADTYDMDFLLTYYSRERLWSQEARSRWLEPDQKPLDFWLNRISCG